MSPNLDVGITYVTHAGLAHSLSLNGQFNLDDWGASLALADSFYALEDIGGILSVRAPVGNRTALTPALWHRQVTDRGVHIDLGVGTDVRIASLVERARIIERAFDPAIETLWLETRARWPGDPGRTTLRFRAIVPINADLHLLGYVPWVGIGRTWGLR